MNDSTFDCPVFSVFHRRNTGGEIYRYLYVHHFILTGSNYSWTYTIRHRQHISNTGTVYWKTTTWTIVHTSTQTRQNNKTITLQVYHHADPASKPSPKYSVRIPGAVTNSGVLQTHHIIPENVVGEDGRAFLGWPRTYGTQQRRMRNEDWRQGIVS